MLLGLNTGPLSSPSPRELRYLPTRCPVLVLADRISLRAGYAMSGTDLAIRYRPTRVLRDVRY
eukprot:3556436-Rhodomonas_salina.1